ncbi:MAG: pitrilysin family protein [Verrucomicrobiota bacterium]
MASSSMYHVSQLPNGLRVATAEMPYMASVSLGIWVGVGSRYEPAELNGACHFIEHMLFKGTRRRSAEEISQAVEGVGGYLNAFTSEEMTCFHARAHADRFDELLDVLADMVLHSKFAPAELNRERDVIKEEVVMYRDQPQQHVQEILNATLWPDQPLGRSITGDEKALDALTRSKLLAYLKKNYLASNTIIVAAGNVSHRRVVKAASRLSRFFKPGARPGFAPSRNDQSAPRVNLCSRKVEQTQIALGIRSCSRHDPRRHALRVLNTLLGENMSSRLFQVIREEHGLAYSIYSTPSFYEDTGDLVISAGLDTENLSRTLRLIFRELKRFIDTTPTVAELRRARDYTIGQIDLSLESTENQMNWLGEQLLGYGRIFQPGDVKRSLRAVSPADVRAAARDFFSPDRFNLALVSPLKSDTHFFRLLQF